MKRTNYVCDRCGKELLEKGYNDPGVSKIFSMSQTRYKLRVFRNWQPWHECGPAYNGLDLCPDCMESFEDWMDGSCVNDVRV